MRVEFLASASSEWTETIAYYNELRAGLGYEFADEVERALTRVLQYPDAWTQVGPRTRRILVDRFPYGLLYFVEEERVIVTAVMNLRRKPTSRD